MINDAEIKIIFKNPGFQSMSINEQKIPKSIWKSRFWTFFLSNFEKSNLLLEEKTCKICTRA
uniref:Uncharacterized protein n=1 Tax=viral metagenome TaxID=1070528 RepID=A0A6C0BA84_9ZZZZ